MQGFVRERFSPDHLQFVRELRAVSNNLNQLARHANAVAHAASVTNWNGRLIPLPEF
ncbi:MAG: plasmid mobilization relaxosome protein MobC [Alistipes indistinctus]